MEDDTQQATIRENALQLLENNPLLGIGITDAYIIESARIRGITHFVSFDIAWEFINGITVWTLPDNHFDDPQVRQQVRHNICTKLGLL